ncbi:hypothetical protein [Dickeya dianthicola]|uniref:hypothetical protein n=1 Tax=Dickeya dianthicola TaxID=204039 RepID=UPI001865D5EB|nr:hypothetical protein [Dickeya dianthicola]QOL13499.1 hypothetical protein HGI48_04230 [Dickeya dianthicola]
MSKAMAFIYLFTLGFSSITYAAHDGVVGQNRNEAKGGLWVSVSQAGGAGLPGGKNGKPGMSGCSGGTLPSSDGKYYLPGTNQECNPAHHRHKHSASPPTL